MNSLVITVDGPSGAGKGTLAQRLAESLGFHLLDSGALYRLVALQARRLALCLEDADAVAQLAASLKPQFKADPDTGMVCVWLDGENVNDALRDEKTAAAASQIAALPAVRQALLEMQRQAARAPGLVADGRDMGTKVFPHAAVKLFLTASAQVRAKRRVKQLNDKGMDVTFDEIYEDVVARDVRDTARAASPLMAAADAHHIDSSELTSDEVLAVALRFIHMAQLGDAH